MRKIMVFIIGFIFLVTTFSTVTVSATTNFTDISNNYWAKEEINYLISEEIIYGYADGSFKPQEKLSRIQIAMMIQRAKGYSQDNRPNPNLIDIKEGTKYYNLIATLIDEGLFTDLVKSGKFEPNKYVTRAEMASVLKKAFHLNGVSTKIFTDVTTDHWAYEYVQALAFNKITLGVGGDKFDPSKEIDRIQFTLFLARTLDERFRVDVGNTLSETLEQLITFPSDQYDRVEAEKMVERISKIYKGYLDLLVLNQVEVRLINNLITDEPEYAYLKGVTPRGWEGSGSTWDDLAGIGGNPTLVRIGYSHFGMGHGSLNLELHEIGHAIDDYVFDGISSTTEFKNIHKVEAKNLIKDHPNAENMYYFTDYPEEYFAECIAYYYLSNELRSELQQKAPLTYKFFKELETKEVD